MKIIIAGAGDVGFHLATLLAHENQEITVIDKDDEKLKNIASKLDVATIRGNATSSTILEEANIRHADLMISATSIEEVNLTSAIFGKNLGAKKTVARVKNLEFLQERERSYLWELGIDELISPELLASSEIERLLNATSLTDLYYFDDGELTLLGIVVDKRCELLNKTIEESAYLNPENDFITVAVLRGSETIIPRGSTTFRDGDHAYFVAKPSGVQRIMKFNSIEAFRIKNIMVLGGGTIGENAARKLSKKYSVKLIEINKERSFDLANNLPDTMVIHGDGRNADIILEEGLDNMDAFIAVTGNSETNILSSLVAKERGVKKTVALVENVDYVHLSQNIGIDTMINRKLIAANNIFRYIRKGDIISIAGIHGVEAEVLEFIVKEKSKITRKYIKNLDFPKKALLCGVVRKGKSRIPNGGFRIRTDDRVVVLCAPEVIHEVENFFSE
ncbi:MAG TPA: Trk system potassium transporter TrkA [Flavobacteriales bacterium]|jgi:trk system potassium uptake protein TrkA|nr:Trk system potassium transporter TrkA [Flavobacteriales bacterium]